MSIRKGRAIVPEHTVSRVKSQDLTPMTNDDPNDELKVKT